MLFDAISRLYAFEYFEFVCVIAMALSRLAVVAVRQDSPST
jgi:hypothetical protein